jgi:hypothetical protein
VAAHLLDGRAIVERGPGNFQDPGGFGLVAKGPVEMLLDIIGLDLLSTNVSAIKMP